MATSTTNTQPAAESRVNKLQRIVYTVVGVIILAAIYFSTRGGPAKASTQASNAIPASTDDLAQRIASEKDRQKDPSESTEPARDPVAEARRLANLPATPKPGETAAAPLFPHRDAGYEPMTRGGGGGDRVQGQRRAHPSSIVLSYRPRTAGDQGARQVADQLLDPNGQRSGNRGGYPPPFAPPGGDDPQQRVAQVAQQLAAAELARRAGAPSGDPNFQRRPELVADRWNGREFLVPEGTFIDTVLLNRLSGDFAGPIQVMVTNAIYSQDKHVLIPEGSKILGVVKPVTAAGQSRLAVTFHRVLMPDDFSVDLDQFMGLDGVGETALKDQTNTHFLSSFFGSVAVGLISGLTQGSAQLGPLGAPASSFDAMKLSAGASVGQSAQNMLTSRFLNRLPTITIREGARVKVYVAQDVKLPSYDAHDMGVQ